MLSRDHVTTADRQQRRTARNPQADPAMLAHLAGGVVGLADVLARNPNLSHERFWRLAEQAPLAAAKNPLLRALAVQPFPWERDPNDLELGAVRLAGVRGTPARLALSVLDALDQIRDGGSTGMVLAGYYLSVFRNPDLPAERLRRYTDPRDERLAARDLVRAAAQRHVSLHDRGVPAFHPPKNLVQALVIDRNAEQPDASEGLGWAALYAYLGWLEPESAKSLPRPFEAYGKTVRGYQMARQHPEVLEGLVAQLGQGGSVPVLPFGQNDTRADLVRRAANHNRITLPLAGLLAVGRLECLPRRVLRHVLVAPFPSVRALLARRSDLPAWLARELELDGDTMVRRARRLAAQRERAS